MGEVFDGLESSTSAEAHTIETNAPIEPTIAPTTLSPTIAPTKAKNSTSESVTLSRWPSLSRNIADSKNRLIVLIASCPYLDLVDNLVQSLLALELHNYVVVPLDESARSYAIELLGADHVVAVPPFAPSLPALKQAKFNSPAFAKITSVRPQVLHAFLDQGFTIFYNDVDVVWRKNIFEVFDPAGENTETSDAVDMVAMVDSHPVEEAFICSCYLYLKPTSPMKNFLLHWQSLMDGAAKKEKKKRYKNDQEAIYDAYQDITKPKNGKESSLKATLYPSDNEFFPSGAVYDIWPGEKQSNAYLVHNNFIRGHNFKINRFLRWNLWKPSSKMEEMDLTCNGKA
ncbi:unnamed protein product [Cylindrotheca closterium]|uniref:Nucleotide-diphospho-sugar transferase domain-containing protein n=1 Tax=Cylindrotheca closterium TaxID=2856 RepID=A0AAD2JN74_9STRA|nr:unnamed protein product [Cylindrotheca closterium]